MAWVLEHIDSDGIVTELTNAFADSGLTVPFRGNADGSAAVFNIIHADAGWSPDINGVIRLREETGELTDRIWFYGKITDVERNDVGTVAGIAAGYTISACDIAGLMKRRLVPYGNTKTERRLRNLPPTINESTYNGTFTPLSTATRVDHQFVLDWALGLINGLEAAAEGTTRGRLIPTIDTAATIYGKPDAVRFPPVGTAAYSGSPAASGHPASDAADGDNATYYQTTAGSGRQWTVTWSDPQAVTKVVIRARSAWTAPVIEFLNSGGAVINTQVITPISAGGNRTLLMTSDVYPAYGMRIRETATGSLTRSLYTVNAYDTQAFYATRSSTGVITGLPIDAEKSSYYELLSQIAEKSGIGWYVDPGTVADGPSFVGYNISRPSFSTFEIADDAAGDITPMRDGSVVIPARSLTVSEASGELANRILVEWIEGPAKAPVTKRTYVPDNARTGAGVKALALESQERFGVREKRLDRDGIKSEASAVILATRELLRNLAGEISGSARIPFTPTLRPGCRIYIHRVHHLPGTAGREYNVSVAYLNSIDLGWEKGAGSTPQWMDLSFGDPTGDVLNLLLAETNVDPTPVTQLTPAVKPAWGSKPTYVIGGPSQSLTSLMVPGIFHLSKGEWAPPGTPTPTITEAPLFGHQYQWSRYWPYSFGYMPANEYSTGPYGTGVLNPLINDVYAVYANGYGSRPILFNFARVAELVPAGAKVIRAMFVWWRGPGDPGEDSTWYESIFSARALPMWEPPAGWLAYPDSPYGDGGASTTPEVMVRSEWAKTTGGRDSLLGSGGVTARPSGELDSLKSPHALEFDWPGSGGATIAVGGISQNAAGERVPVVPTLIQNGLIEADLVTSTASVAGLDTLGNVMPVRLWTTEQEYHYTAPTAPAAVEWTTANRVPAGWHFDPSDPDSINEYTLPLGDQNYHVPSGPYLMFMIDDTAPVAVGEVMEDRLSFDDKATTVFFTRRSVPSTVLVYINGVECSEGNGKLALIYDEDDFATGFDVSLGTNPIRPNGLRNYAIPGAPNQADLVIARYEVAT